QGWGEHLARSEEEIGMTRLTLALAVWVSLISVASASLTPRKQTSTFANQIPPAQTARLLTETLRRAAGGENKWEIALTDQTEILLNGKPCRYEEVPRNASIMQMEVAEDKKTVLKIHFRTRK